MSKTRVLIVDDSPTMRSLIAAVLKGDPAIEVVGQAGDPLEAREAIKALNPDVLTLDVEMPRMDGVEFLDRIMRLRPMPVVMVSTLTQAGAETTLRALELGAFDCVAKPVAFDSGGELDRLVETVKAAARSRVRRPSDRRLSGPRADYRGNGSVVAIGSSTGGVEALLSVLGEFPKECPPTVVVQHMPASFTRSFAERLNRTCAPEVAEAVDGAPLLPGHVYLAPGGDRHLQVAGGSRPFCRLAPGETVSGHRPSVDVLFGSVARNIGPAAVGVILTGMGRDGAEGLLEMRRAGAKTLGQDETTSIVYGMPKAAWTLGAVERQLPLEAIASAILDLCTAERREHH